MLIRVDSMPFFRFTLLLAAFGLLWPFSTEASLRTARLVENVCGRRLSETAINGELVRIATGIDDNGSSFTVRSRNGELFLMKDGGNTIGRKLFPRPRVQPLREGNLGEEKRWLSLSAFALSSNLGLSAKRALVAVDNSGEMVLLIDSSSKELARAIAQSRFNSEVESNEFIPIALGKAVEQPFEPRVTAISAWPERSGGRTTLTIYAASENAIYRSDFPLSLDSLVGIDASGSATFKKVSDQGGNYLQAVSQNAVVVAKENGKVCKQVFSGKRAKTEKLGAVPGRYLADLAGYQIPGQDLALWALSFSSEKETNELYKWDSEKRNFVRYPHQLSDNEFPIAISAAGSSIRASNQRTVSEDDGYFTLVGANAQSERVVVSSRMQQASGSVIYQTSGLASDGKFYGLDWLRISEPMEQISFAQELLRLRISPFVGKRTMISEIRSALTQKYVVLPPEYSQYVDILVSTWAKRLVAYLALTDVGTGVASKITSIAPMDNIETMVLLMDLLSPETQEDLMSPAIALKESSVRDLEHNITLLTSSSAEAKKEIEAFIYHIHSKRKLKGWSERSIEELVTTADLEGNHYINALDKLSYHSPLSSVVAFSKSFNAWYNTRQEKEADRRFEATLRDFLRARWLDPLWGVWTSEKVEEFLKANP